MDAIIEKVLSMIPRKIIGGLVGMYLIGYFAEKGIDWKILALMTVIGIGSVASHWALEWKNPTQNGAAK